MLHYPPRLLRHRSLSIFLDPSRRSDETLQNLFLPGPAHDNTGVMQFATGDGERGGFWLYVPEHYTPDHAWPLVMAPRYCSSNALPDAAGKRSQMDPPTSSSRVRCSTRRTGWIRWRWPRSRP